MELSTDGLSFGLEHIKIDESSLDGISDKPSDEELRSLHFQLERKKNGNVEEGRWINFQYKNNDEVEALMILRCTGQKVNTSATDQTKIDMPYFYSKVTLVYHSRNERAHGDGFLFSKTGTVTYIDSQGVTQTLDHPGFTCKENRLKFTWHGPQFEDIKTNENGRKWEIMLVLGKNLSAMNLDDKTDQENYLKLHVGEVEPDGYDTPDASILAGKTALEQEDIKKNFTGKSYLNLKQYKLRNEHTTLDVLNPKMEVPFYSDWQPIVFTRTGNGTDVNNPKNQPVGDVDKDNKPLYSFDVITTTIKGRELDHVLVRPRGVFVLINLNKANATPFDIYGRGIHIATTAYSFAGNYDFSEETLKANDGEPVWDPITIAKAKPNQYLEYIPDAGISKVPVFRMDFRLEETGDANHSGKGVFFAKQTNQTASATNPQHLFLFWAMPNDIKGAEDNDYFTQMFLRCTVEGQDDKRTTNFNVMKYREGEVAAIFHGDKVAGVTGSGPGGTVTTLDILKGQDGPLRDYLRHGSIAARSSGTLMPSIKNFPLYSSRGKCVYKQEDMQKAGQAMQNGQKARELPHKLGEIKHGRILYATTQTLARPQIFIEFISETPLYNIHEGGHYQGFDSGIYHHIHAGWASNANQPFAWRLDWQPTLVGTKLELLNINGKDKEVPTEFLMTYGRAKELANLPRVKERGYIPHPVDPNYYTYFRQELSARKTGVVEEKASDIPANPDDMYVGGNKYLNRSINRWSQLGFETSPKRRTSYVRKGGPGTNGNVLLGYAIRYIDHFPTCQSASDPCGVDWQNCNVRRCAVRYKQIGNPNGMLALTARYIGRNDALSALDNPIWAEENFWKHNVEDDIVRYFPFYGYTYERTYFEMGMRGIFWTNKPAPGKTATSYHVFYPSCGAVGNFAYHSYLDSSTLGNYEDRGGCYLFMNQANWFEGPKTHL